MGKLNYLNQIKDESNYFDRYSPLYLKYGPWAIVTGAASSIGREFARKLAEQGLNLVLVSRRNYILEDLATDLMSRHGVQIVDVIMDMKSPDSMKELAKKTSHLEVGMFVCGAGFETSFNQEKIEEEISSLENQSLTLLTKIWNDDLPTHKQNRGGLILMNSFFNSKSTKKTYVDSLAQVLDSSLSPYGVDVVAATPKLLNIKNGNAMSEEALKWMREPSCIVDKSLKALLKKSQVQVGWLSKFWKGSVSSLPMWAQAMMDREAEKALN